MSFLLRSLTSLPKRQLTLPKKQSMVYQQLRGAKMRAQHLEVGTKRRLAYRQVPGQKKPTIVMVPGLHSYLHMQGMTARALLRFCDLNDFPGVIYDHECTGESNFGDPIINNTKDVLFSHWIQDVHAVIDQLTEGPIVLVGCSMGGWLALVAGEQLKERLHGMLLYAPALNYVYPYYQTHLSRLPEDVQHRVENGDWLATHHTMGSALMKKDFAEDSREYEVDLSKPVNIKCPVRIMHGLEDTEISFTQTLELCQSIATKDVDLIIRKNGPHQLDQPHDIEIFLNTLDRMLKDHPVES